MSKYNWPEKPGDFITYRLDDINLPTLRTAATMRGTRYGHYLKVEKRGEHAIVTCIEAPQRPSRKHIATNEEIVELLRLITRDIAQIKERLYNLEK